MRPSSNNLPDLSSFAATSNHSIARSSPRQAPEPESSASFVNAARLHGSADLSVESERLPETARQSGDTWPEHTSMGPPNRDTTIPVDTERTQEPRTETPVKKASKHRKRFAPPGPAGVWFHSRRHSKQKKGLSRRHHGQVDSTTGQEEDDDDTTKRDEEHNAPIEDISSCPAWMCMQKSLGLCTPFLPSYYGSKERYEPLRKHVPSEYSLLMEIHQGLHDLRLVDKSLIVLVHSVQYHGHVDWTVELRDECGDRIRAWLEPELVEREQEQSRYVRLGVVWCLTDVSMAVSAKDGTASVGSSSVERMLLVSQSNIARMWTPQQASDEVSDTEFLDWMHQRTSLRSEHFREDEEISHGSQTEVLHKLSRAESPPTNEGINYPESSNDLSEPTDSPQIPPMPSEQLGLDRERDLDSPRRPLAPIGQLSESQKLYTTEVTQRSAEQVDVCRREPTTESKENSRKRPKESSDLWLMQDDSMMNLLEKDEDEQDVRINTDEPTSGQTQHEKEPPETKNSEPTSSLFQVGSFDGVNVDELFDDED